MKKIISLMSIVVLVIGILVGCSSTNNTQQSTIDMSDVDSSDIDYFTEVLSGRVIDEYDMDNSMYMDYDKINNFVTIHVPMKNEYLLEKDMTEIRQAITTDTNSIGTRIVDVFNNTLLAYQNSGITCNLMLEVTDELFTSHGAVIEIYCNHPITLDDIKDRSEDLYKYGRIMID